MVFFLRRREGLKKINEFKDIKSSIILYESPYRVNKTLSDLFDILGNRKVFISREMTKLYEEYSYSDLKTLAANGDQKTPKGEFVIVLAKEGYKCE